MSENETKERVRSFLSTYLRDKHLREDTDLFASGLLSSLFAMELVLFVEEEFSIVVENEDLDLDHFCSIRAITRFVEKKRKNP